MTLRLRIAAAAGIAVAITAVALAAGDYAGTRSTLRDQIDKALFDGMTGALDRFSRYASPEIARGQRAVRDGFGGIGITLDVSGEEFRITQVTSGGPADRAGVRRDYAHVSDTDFAAGRAAVLRDLAARARLFHTAYAREHWEPAARANLARELERLQPQV